MVSWSMDSEPSKRSTCLGYWERLKGQNRVPEPPARITPHLMPGPPYAGKPGGSQRAGNGRPVSAEIVEEGPYVGPGRNQEKKEILLAYRSEHGQPITVLEHTGRQLVALSGPAKAPGALRE